MFYVGQRVVCVNNERGFMQPILCPLQRGAVYVVNEIVDSGHVDGPIISVDGDPVHLWLATRFRPAVERKTSIEIFTRMLNPSKERETV